ncbi:hypothetical protein C8R41DRAFT_527135 [Lentinula lateritia]|uniref:Uncharacterized protein n=1 Tax=Lentinula lateritia TaxID=40482 RepID=A0ABQ8V747_9AGAR|nr:hypothetical protein C8R41DRAFT_527135 [Lentinula lateritia]
MRMRQKIELDRGLRMMLIPRISPSNRSNPFAYPVYQNQSPLYHAGCAKWEDILKMSYDNSLWASSIASFVYNETHPANRSKLGEWFGGPIK